MGFWDRKKSGKILKMAVFSLFLLFFCTRICVYAAENQDFSREEEALGELDLKEVEMAVDQLLEEKQSMRGMIRDILKSGQAFSAEQWKAVIQQGVWERNLRAHSGAGASVSSVLSSVRGFSEQSDRRYFFLYDISVVIFTASAGI